MCSKDLWIRIGRKKCVNYNKIENAQDCVNQVFNPTHILLAGATWYYYTIYILFTYFAAFTCYEISIVEVNSNLHVQRCKFDRKIYKFKGKYF